MNFATNSWDHGARVLELSSYLEFLDTFSRTPAAQTGAIYLTLARRYHCICPCPCRPHAAVPVTCAILVTSRSLMDYSLPASTAPSLDMAASSLLRPVNLEDP